jgi:multisubunit Na+/H+ antiporter MnhF subunit
VNAWLIAATVLLAAQAPLLIVLARAPRIDALVALELAGTNATIVLLLFAEGFNRSFYDGPAIVLALLSFAGSLVFARVLERWL